jgi:ornithine cyclodeaminase/alanine dehydrogenase-like protein (mu-crystallin family)
VICYDINKAEHKVYRKIVTENAILYKVVGEGVTDKTIGKQILERSEEQSRWGRAFKANET